LTAFRELFEELIAEDFGGWGGLHDLQEEFGGCFGFFDAGGELVGRGKSIVAVGAGEVVLLSGVEGGGVEGSGGGLLEIVSKLGRLGVPELTTGAT